MDLFSPLNVGNITLNNRIVMAPLTRCRSVEEHRANAMMADYYAQRASAGLIISEATMVSPMGMGYPATPGIYTPEQVESWKQVTQAVHDKGGKIYLQLWHVGRISHPSFLGGELPLAPSAVQPAGQTFTFEGMQDYVTPRPLETAEIPGIVEQYVDGAKNAIAAGFDGVEIHGANGYLIDQFLRDGTNRREDAYGGSVENRVRFLLEIVEGVSAAIGADRTGVRLSPSGTFNDMSDSDPKTLFTYALNRLSDANLAYVHIVDALEGDIRHGANVVELAALRDAYKGVLITCGGYDKARGNAVIADGLADAVAYGLLYIANPDLPERFNADAPLNEPDPDTFYTQDEKGYLDYPTLS
ncbi:alkene reductase [Sulfurimonas diazotrophicus]|uniref:Alkene reductase n=1 Tax=Sulfurimonas diazotrophicus TaxID=3131939 RepID=A0ABZ3HE50_9BACT